MLISKQKKNLANRMHYPGITCALFDYEHLVVWTNVLLL